MSIVSDKNAKNVDIDKLPLMEHFYTLQGEGFHTGKASYFIRLGGCDVGCHWCDVKESWDVSAFPLVHVQDMAKTAASYAPPIAVVTGGEPLMHDLSGLTDALRSFNIRTHIETSGVYPVTGNWDWICFSPKKFKAPDHTVYMLAHELKVIIYNKSDLEWAESFAGKMNQDCHFFLQPEWSKKEQMHPIIVDYILKNPRWRLSVQVHKYLNIP
jgi:7-carboxy-7-deazaguanine synthase